MKNTSKALRIILAVILGTVLTALAGAGPTTDGLIPLPSAALRW